MMNRRRIHLPCEDCRSSDGLADYGDSTYCFVCRKLTRLTDNKEEARKKLVNDYHSYALKEVQKEYDRCKINIVSPINFDKIQELTDRKITKKTAGFYNVWINDANEHVYPYYTRDGKSLIANKFRDTKQKGFTTQGEISKSGLFGQQLFPAASALQITVCEGEVDSLSIYQMQGSKYPAVSIKSASSARKDVADNFEYLNSFDKIVLCFDKDEPHKRSDGTVFYPGQEAAEQVASMFPLGKVRILTLKDAKDANDYLKMGWTEKFVKEWWAASTWSPVGLRNAKDMWEEVIKDDEYESVPWPWDGLNKLTYGVRTSEFVTITADPGVGKTSVIRETVYNILQKILSSKDDSRCVGLMMLEDSNKESLLGLMSLVANKPLHLPDIKAATSKEELRKYFDTAYGQGKVIVWDHFGSNEIEKVLSFVRYMHNLGCKYIVLDHLSIVVSDQSGDERKQLDEISTKLKTLTMELGIALICVIHQNRKGEIRGTMGVEQLSNIVIKLYRDVKSDDPEIRDITKVTVEKNRFCGRTGPACLLKYDAETGRLCELPEEDLYRFLDKDKKKVDKEDW